MEVVIKEVLDLFKRCEVFTKNDFRLAIKEIKSTYSERSVGWMLTKLKREGKIISLGRGKYMLPNSKMKRSYSYDHLDLYREVEEAIEKRFPLVKFQMWELVQLNEFVNHLLGKNVIFLEVEKEGTEFVFEYLRDLFPSVLALPDEKTFYRYRREETIVVLNLISESPKAEGHSAPLEKILVDLCVNKLTGNMISKSEYSAIFSDSREMYYLNEAKMLRYARRRNVERLVKDYLEDKFPN